MNCLISGSAELKRSGRCLERMQFLVVVAALLLTGCGPGLVFNNSEMTPDQMQARADHVFIGVIEKQEVESWLFLNVPGSKTGDWTILKRQVRIETVLRGRESHPSVFLYEYFPTGNGPAFGTRRTKANVIFFWSASKMAAIVVFGTSCEVSSRYTAASMLACLSTMAIPCGNASAC
jgi:hypothetical protein